MIPAIPEKPLLQVVVLPALADDLLTDQLLSGNDDVAPNVHLVKPETGQR